MNFCAGCGSPNLDTDANCRVCGRSLSETPTPQPTATAARPTGTGVASPEPAAPLPSGGAEPPPPAARPGLNAEPVDPGPPVSPQRATPPQTGAATLSGFEGVPSPTAEPAARANDSLPSFMRPQTRAATAPPANESASLISEHDLPEWIRQIAADDAKRLAAAQEQEAAAAAALGSSMPSHLGRRPLPGETPTAGPASSSWLNRRDVVAGAAGAAWDVTGASAPSRPVVFPVEEAAHAQLSSPSSAVPAVEDVVVAEAIQAAPSKRRRRGPSVEKAAPTVGETRAKPRERVTGGDRTRLYLVAAIVVALVFALGMAVL